MLNQLVLIFLRFNTFLSKKHEVNSDSCQRLLIVFIDWKKCIYAGVLLQPKLNDGETRSKSKRLFASVRAK